MKVFTPRNIFADLCDCTPKQWISLCNTFLLLLVTLMCGMVIYETYDLDQRFISILDSSVLSIDLTSLDALESETAPYWRNVTENIAVYSAFHDVANIQDSFLVVIGRTTKNWTTSENLRCIIKYPDDEIRLVNASVVKSTNCNSAVFYCSTIKELVPEKVAVISLADVAPKQWLIVEVYDSSKRVHSIAENVAACVSPLTNTMKAEDIAEFIAFYETIGVNSFYFYSHDAPLEVLNFLRRLINNGHGIHLQSWTTDDRICNTHVAASGHVLDCIHRCVVKQSEVVLVGVKDLIFPKQHLLTDTLKDIRQTVTNSSMIALRYKMFCGDNSNDAFASSVVSSTTPRDETMKTDVNFIVKPYSVAASSINSIAEGEDSRVFLLSEDEAFIHRYAINCSSLNTFDKDIYKYLPFFNNSAVFAELRRNML